MFRLFYAGNGAVSEGRDIGAPIKGAGIMPIITAVALIAASATFAPAMPMSDSKSVRTVVPLCKPSAPQRVRKVDGPTVRKLGDEPNADGIAAVLYTEGHCSKPIVISRNLGANPKRR